MKHLCLSFAALLALGTVAVLPVPAQISAVPNSINFSGRLATPAGNPVPDGTYSIRFSLHDALTGGTEKWSKTVANVQVRNGTFAVTFDAFPANTFNGNLWLEIKIGTDAAHTPRTPLVSVPYAMKSDLALTVPDGSITAAKLASGTLGLLAWLRTGNIGGSSSFLGTTDSSPLIFRTNNLERMRINSDGRIAVTPPAYLDLGNNVSGREQNAGKIGYGLFTANTLDIIGAGPANGLRRAKIWAEGGTIFTGGVSMTGDLGVGGVVSAFNLDITTTDGNNSISVNNNHPERVGVLSQSGRAVSALGKIRGVIARASNADGIGLEVSGNGYAILADGQAAGNTGWANISDGRFKRNIATYPNALETILGMRGVVYEWNTEAYADRNFAAGKQVGFIAQEIEKILPELVHTDSRGYKSVMYANAVPILVEAVKTLNSKVERLQKIEVENAELKARLDAIERTLTELKANRSSHIE